jgi:hypothetical protein
MSEFLLNRKEIREILNRMPLGSIIAVTSFPQKIYASGYFCDLEQNGFLERVSRGRYKTLKKIVLRRRGHLKGVRHLKTMKDLSVIPTIVKSDEKGLVMKQIFLLYKRLVPEKHQVNMNFLYRLFAFGIKEGIFENNGFNIEQKDHFRGPTPKRIVFKNSNLTIDKWNEFVDKYRLWYQYKKENKVNRISKCKTVINSSDNGHVIIKSFGEDRNNTNKKFVEEYFLNEIKKHLGGNKIDCFIISGPDYNRHVIKLFDTIANHVIICEKNQNVFSVIYKKAQICPYYINQKVSLINSDIKDVFPSNCLFVDLDLMSSLQTIEQLILNTIRYQDYNYSSNVKFISFTTSIRNDGGFPKRNDLLKSILNKGFNIVFDERNVDIFNAKIPMSDKSTIGNFCIKHTPQIKDFGRAVDISIFTYEDTSPMLSVLISYR